MYKLIAALIALVVMPLALSACGGSADGATGHTGTWKADGFVAHITADTITLEIADESSKSLYWKGSFQEGAKVVNSVADREALDGSMLGSQDATKTFAVDKDEIHFSFTMMGTTRSVHLKRS